jgi:CheY-like chemotaxis protein
MKTILVVDDEFALVESLSDVLQDAGYRVVSAANGMDGLARLAKEKPDLVLVDLMMPIADGREMVRGMRATTEYQAAPVVLMSAAPKSVALSNGEDDGRLEVAGFISKPFQVEKLLDTIVRLIGKGEPNDGSHETSK